MPNFQKKITNFFYGFQILPEKYMSKSSSNYSQIYNFTDGRTKNREQIANLVFEQQNG